MVCLIVAVGLQCFAWRVDFGVELLAGEEVCCLGGICACRLIWVLILGWVGGRLGLGLSYCLLLWVYRLCILYF